MAITRSFIRLTLPLELPVALMNKVQSHPFPNSAAIWRLAFSGPMATEPVISSLVKSTGVHINILQANLELIRHQHLGMMIIAVQGSDTELVQSKKYLEQRGLKVEIIGYVSSDDWIVP